MKKLYVIKTELITPGITFKTYFAGGDERQLFPSRTQNLIAARKYKSKIKARKILTTMNNISLSCLWEMEEIKWQEPTSLQQIQIPLGTK